MSSSIEIRGRFICEKTGFKNAKKSKKSGVLKKNRSPAAKRGHKVTLRSIHMIIHMTIHMSIYMNTTTQMSTSIHTLTSMKLTHIIQLTKNLSQRRVSHLPKYTIKHPMVVKRNL